MDQKTTLAASSPGVAATPGGPTEAGIRSASAGGDRGAETILASAFATLSVSGTTAAGDDSPPGPDADRRRPLPEVPGFEVLGELGRGGMGVVYLARRAVLNRPCALKMILAAEHASPEAGVRFLVEAEAVARIRHPNVIQIYSIGNRGEFPYLELEYADGGSLEKRLDGVPWSPRRAAEMIETLARAVAEAHRLGLIHRDLKPANVLLMADGTPKVADFGLAKGLDSGHGLTRTDSVMGSPSYMAPEQADGQTKDVGPTADVYSLGAILYELLCGRPPFRGATALQTLDQVRKIDPVPPSRLIPSTPRDVETIALRCLEKDPARRYPAAADLAEDLRRWLAREPILARPIGRPERLLRWCQRRPSLAAMSAALVLVAALGFAGVAWQWRRAVLALESAVRSKDEAIAARDVADVLATERTAALAVARRQTYRSTIAAASAAIQLNNAGPARAALMLTPEEYRKTWEWRHLSSEMDNSRSSTRLPGSWRSYAMSPVADGSRAASSTSGNLLRLWELPTGRPVASFASTPIGDGPVYSPDGRRMAYRAAGGRLGLVDAADGRLAAEWGVPGVEIRALRFSPDARRIAGLGTDGRVRVWEAGTGAEIASWPVPDLTPDSAMETFLYHPGGKSVLIGTKGRVRLIDLDTGAVLRTLEMSARRPWIAFSPDGRRLAWAFDYPDNAIRIWDLAGTSEPAVLAGHINQVSVVAFSPDGSRLASGSMDQTVRLWDGITGAPVSVLRGHSGIIAQIAFNPDGSRMVTGSEDRTIRLWDVASSAPISVLRGHEQTVVDVAYLGDGSTIESVSSDGDFRFWDAATLERNGVLRDHSGFVYDVAFTPDGSRLVSAAWDGTARVWDAASGRPIEVLRHATNILTSASLGAGGSRLAVVERDANRVDVWDVPGARRLYSVEVPTSPTYLSPRAALDPAGSLLAAGGIDGIVRTFDAATGVPIATIPAHKGPVEDLAFRPDGARLASAGSDGAVRIWDAKTRAPLAALEGHPGRVYRLSYSADGRILAASSLATVTLWEPETGRKIGVLTQPGVAYGTAFSPDGTRLAVGCSDNTIRLWDVATREEVAELRGHDDYIHAVAFSPDGTRLVSASGDCTIRIWDTLPARERSRH